MKAFLLFLFSCLTLSIHAQYLTVGLGTHIPVGAQKDRLKNAYGMTLGYEHAISKSPFYFVVDGSWSIFDLQTVKQDVEGPDGSITTQKITYTSSIFNLTPGIGFAPLRHKKVSPYVAVKGGYAKYKTRMALYDPEEDDGCHPLEEENILRDVTAVAVANGGVSVKVPACKKPFYFDLGANYITGGRAEYLRMNKDENQPAAAEAAPHMVKFEHIQSGEVHEHSLGKVYTTKTSQLQFYIRIKIPIL